MGRKIHQPAVSRRLREDRPVNTLAEDLLDRGFVFFGGCKFGAGNRRRDSPDVDSLLSTLSPFKDGFPGGME
jgi:hypothetical protein